MTIDEMDLRHAITDLRDAYHNLDAAKYTPRRVRTSRRMQPRPGPRSPMPDQDWALNLETSLLWETRDDTVPGGLLVMTHDALAHTDAGDQHIQPTTGAMCCAHLWRNAGEVCWKHPAAQELLELLEEQTAYIVRKLRARYPEPRPLPKAEPRHNATTIVRLLGQKGHRITPQHLTTWAARGHITTAHTTTGATGYLLTEVLDWVTRDDTPTTTPPA